eukprot:COSAG01_NODE_5090_length_4493_cov_3.897132_1_plen_119_part_10
MFQAHRHTVEEGEVEETEEEEEAGTATATPAKADEVSDEEKARLRELRKRQLLQLRADFYRAMQRLPDGCIPIATDGGYIAANTDPRVMCRSNPFLYIAKNDKRSVRTVSIVVTSNSID